LALGSTIDSIVPSEVPIYSWNLGGYRMAHVEAGPGRYSFAGLTDQSWRMIPLLEGGSEEGWPF